MAQDRVPLYVRLPRAQADALDRMVDATGRRKQQLVSDLLADRLQVGYAEVVEPDAPPEPEVLTLDEAAELLRVAARHVRERAAAGDLPGRHLGGEWRFSRAAVLAWLADGESPADA